MLPKAEKGKTMYKLMINGQPYIKVRTIREEIRYLRKNVDTIYHNFDESHRAMVQLAYNDIVRSIYREELNAAETPEDVEAILEMPGDFVVIKGRKIGELQGFLGWEDGKAIIGDINKSMFFSYESKAQEIAEQLGEGWRVFDMSPEDNERTQRFLNAVFKENDNEK